jgi:hypothetical protein
VEVVTVPAVTGKVVEVEPCGTVTDAGTVAAAEDALNATVAPPLGAADVSVTVQVDPTDGVRVVGLHEMPLKAGVWRIVTVLPIADVGMAAPAESAESPFVSWTDDAVSDVEPANVSVTEATTLFGIVIEFRPQSKHVAVPVPLLQVSDLFAAPTPGEKLAAVKSVGE